ncbi:LuxR family transcriptional regulator [Pandoraea horticolens]|uniref:LuxR family transcriptional regulator n=1 Tax=Pandoraea horticolens TaxID=2508298 RepID=A0A5E4Y5N4_9BURK|nr:LuxR family transcriptional regulator [Pandoraea horticolens]
MHAIAPIRAWDGCDPKLRDAIAALSTAWGSYSAQSRRYPIFKLLRELIDPAWVDLRDRYEALSAQTLNIAWMRHRLKAMTLAEQTRFSGLGGTTALSTIAQCCGLTSLDQFLQEVGREIMKKPADAEPSCLEQSLDSLREVAMRCRGKTTKRRSLGKFGRVDLLHGMSTCRSCAQPTELAAHLAEAHGTSPEGSRLSSIYCGVHSPKKAGSSTTRAKYKQARRTQQTFEIELKRLEHQYWGHAATIRTELPAQTIDEFFRRLSVLKRLRIDDECGTSTSETEERLRSEARKLVDRRMSDRKKEIVVLLANGKSQPQIAEALGLKSRQAISKTLRTIHIDYRFDIDQTEPPATACNRHAIAKPLACRA